MEGASDEAPLLGPPLRPDGSSLPTPRRRGAGATRPIAVPIPGNVLGVEVGTDVFRVAALNGATEVTLVGGGLLDAAAFLRDAVGLVRCIQEGDGEEIVVGMFGLSTETYALVNASTDLTENLSHAQATLDTLQGMEGVLRSIGPVISAISILLHCRVARLSTRAMQEHTRHAENLVEIIEERVAKESAGGTDLLAALADLEGTAAERAKYTTVRNLLSTGTDAAEFGLAIAMLAGTLNPAFAAVIGTCAAMVSVYRVGMHVHENRETVEDSFVSLLVKTRQECRELILLPALLEERIATARIDRRSEATAQPHKVDDLQAHLQVQLLNMLAYLHKIADPAQTNLSVSRQGAHDQPPTSEELQALALETEAPELARLIDPASPSMSSAEELLRALRVKSPTDYGFLTYVFRAVPDSSSSGPRPDPIAAAQRKLTLLFQAPVETLSEITEADREGLLRSLDPVDTKHRGRLANALAANTKRMTKASALTYRKVHEQIIRSYQRIEAKLAVEYRKLPNANASSADATDALLRHYGVYIMEWARIEQLEPDAQAGAIADFLKEIRRGSSLTSDNLQDLETLLKRDPKALTPQELLINIRKIANAMSRNPARPYDDGLVDLHRCFAPGVGCSPGNYLAHKVRFYGLLVPDEELQEKPEGLP